MTNLTPSPTPSTSTPYPPTLKLPASALYLAFFEPPNGYVEVQHLPVRDLYLASVWLDDAIVAVRWFEPLASPDFPSELCIPAAFAREQYRGVVGGGARRRQSREYSYVVRPGCLEVGHEGQVIATHTFPAEMPPCRPWLSYPGDSARPTTLYLGAHTTVPTLDTLRERLAKDRARHATDPSIMF